MRIGLTTGVFSLQMLTWTVGLIALRDENGHGNGDGDADD